MRFDLSDLRLFLNVVEAGSITHGAEHMHLAIAAASTRIRNMEAALGTPLLHRERQGVQPTPAGRTLVHHARMLLQQAERMHGDLAQYADLSNAMSGSASSRRLPPSATPRQCRSAGSSWPTTGRCAI